MYKLTLVAMSLLLTVVGWADARSEIERAYLRSSKAMGLKYLDGVFSIRTQDYQVSDPDGVVIAGPVERGRLERLLMPALKVRESAKILSFRQQGSTAYCRTQFATSFVLLDTVKNKPVTLELDSLLEDEWVLQGKSWMLRRSKVLHQNGEQKAGL